MTREDLVNLLQTTVATITFTKVDGTERVMKCTLISDFLPALKGSNNARNQSVLPVWDVEKEAWRSFKLESVKRIEV